jgi:hypothetical protein
MDHHIMNTHRTRILASFALVILCFAIVSIGARSAPITGSWSNFVEIDTKVWSQTNKFRGGERAAVLAIGAGTKMRVAVYDAKGELIAEDKGEGDYVGLVWYPPRDGEYRIDVSQDGVGANKVYIAIK